MRSAPMPLPSQSSEIDAQLAHADGFVAMGQTVLALGMYRTAALLAEQRGDLGRALSIHARIARIDPDPGARMRIGELQLALGQRTEAAAMLDGVARDEQRTGRLLQALHAATTAASAVPSIERHLVAADLGRRTGRLDIAVEHYDAAAKLELDAGRVAQARSLCTHALHLYPQHVPTLRIAADANLRARDMHRAVAAIKGILAVDPNDAGALESMAEAFAMIGKKQSAAEVVRLLAVRMHEAAANDDARALVQRGLAWDPASEALKQLQHTLTNPQPPSVVVHEAPKVVARTPPQPPPKVKPIATVGDGDSTRVIDLADLVEIRPVAQPATPIRRAGPPQPQRRTGPYATRPPIPARVAR
jgi:tetratricopeptide (TPR) repeat protein